MRRGHLECLKKENGRVTVHVAFFCWFSVSTCMEVIYVGSLVGSFYYWDLPRVSNKQDFDCYSVMCVVLDWSTRTTKYWWAPNKSPRPTLINKIRTVNDGTLSFCTFSFCLFHILTNVFWIIIYRLVLLNSHLFYQITTSSITHKVWI